MATLRRPATRAKHNEVSIILILLLRPKTEAKGGGLFDCTRRYHTLH